MNKFHVGQRVAWRSARGHLHEGKIAERVEPKHLPKLGKPRWGIFRGEVSYVVEYRSGLFWPESTRLTLLDRPGSDESRVAGRKG